MNKLESQYITGVIYTELSEELGPNPVIWMPVDLDPRITMHAGIKGITLLTAEAGKIPDSVVILPFPSLNLKGIIRYLEWTDPSKRGSSALATITLLIKEADDIIFYKYIEEIQPLFDSTAKNLIEMEQTERDEDFITQELNTLCHNIDALLDQFKIKEQIRVEHPVDIPMKIDPNAEMYQFKLVICGDPHVGKSSLVLRYINKVFNRSYLPTLGVNVSSRIIPINDVLVQLVVWDIAGQVKFENMRTAFYKGARSAFFVFDLTSRKSFESISNWYKDVQKKLKNYDFPVGFVIGNKKDLKKKRKISGEQAKKLAESLDLDYFETSALTGDNVKLAFEEIAQKLLDVNR